MCLGVFVCMCVYFQEKDNIIVYVRKGMGVVFNFFFSFMNCTGFCVAKFMLK